MLTVTVYVTGRNGQISQQDHKAPNIAAAQLLAAKWDRRPRTSTVIWQGTKQQPKLDPTDPSALQRVLEHVKVAPPKGLSDIGAKQLRCIMADIDHSIFNIRAMTPVGEKVCIEGCVPHWRRKLEGVGVYI